METPRPSLRASSLLTWTLLMTLLSSCGSDHYDRPEVVATFPTGSAILDGALAEIRVEYGEPVSILRGDYVGVSANGVGVPVTMRSCPDDPTCVLIRPHDGFSFPPNSLHNVIIGEGAVINDDRNYSLELFSFHFTTGDAPDVMVGSPGLVSFLDADTLASTGSIATPAGRNPVGIIDGYAGATRRVWVQLDDGDGTGTALAYFEPGDADMTIVTLSTEGALGDLSATSSAIVMGPAGENVYVAYRDDDEGRVRLFKVNVEAGDESGALMLSIAMDGASMPLGLAHDRAQNRLLVSCADGATGRLAIVDLESFTEVDQDPVTAGTQAIVLPEGAGPVVSQGTRALLGHPSNSSVTIVDLQIPEAEVSSSTTVSSGAATIASTQDAALAFVAHTGFAAQEAIDLRTLDDGYQNPIPVAFIDATAAGSTGATSVMTMARMANPDQFLVIFNSDYATIFTLTENDFVQEDLDEITDDIQGVDLSASAPGITTIGRAFGAYPP